MNRGDRESRSPRSPRVAVSVNRGHRESRSSRIAVSVNRGHRESRSPRIAVSANRGLRESRSPGIAVTANRGLSESWSPRISVSVNCGLCESRSPRIVVSASTANRGLRGHGDSRRARFTDTAIPRLLNKICPVRKLLVSAFKSRRLDLKEDAVPTTFNQKIKYGKECPPKNRGTP